MDVNVTTNNNWASVRHKRFKYCDKFLKEHTEKVAGAWTVYSQ